MPKPPGPPQKFTAADRWDYTVAELRTIAAEHDLLPATSRMTHDELVELITSACISLPRKPLERMSLYRRRKGPEPNGNHWHALLFRVTLC